MSRKVVYNIYDFSGGITDKIRDTSDLTKCAYVSHFDIYRDPNKMYPMPGYIDDMNDGSTSTGMKQYSVAAFLWTSGQLWAVGTKSDGTGWKQFLKEDPTDAAWDTTPLTVSMEGTYTLYKGTYLDGNGSNQYFVTTDAGKTYCTESNVGTPTHVEILSFAESQPTVPGSKKMTAELAHNGSVYMTKRYANIDTHNYSVQSANAKTTNQLNSDLASSDELLGIIGYPSTYLNAQLLLWDATNELIDRKIDFGKGLGRCVGNVDGTWIGIVEENLSAVGNEAYTQQVNGMHSFAVKYAGVAGTAQTLTRVYAATSTNAKLEPNRGRYRDAMLFEARIPTNGAGSTFKEGVWAVGRSTPLSGVALSHLLDTSSLGTIEAYYTFGDHHYFAHGGDGSISRLDNFTTGTYDVTAVYETLMFGADSPQNKSLNGISVHTENLPASATVVVKYRFDENDSWTSLGTSDTDGDQIHHFTGLVGEFKEIQFRVEVLGNAPVKNIYVSLQELDTTPYDA